jgi:putative Ca2+/H+ antiporter (TMEM165/GDT1 family)
VERSGCPCGERSVERGRPTERGDRRVSDFLTVVIAAMVAQLAVLPGEKVQFIIAALSTRYRPVVVVSAAGLAFAVWTALEVWLGGALKGALPPVYLDVIAGGLFLLFGVLLVRSMPDSSGFNGSSETDGGLVSVDGSLEVSVAGQTVPDRFGDFIPIFVLMAVGEFGDKTQLVTISLAVQYGAHPGIWVGEMLVILPVSLANAYLFSHFSGRFDTRKAHAAAAALFFFFGLDTFLGIITGFSVWETVVGAVTALLAGVAESLGLVFPAGLA